MSSFVLQGSAIEVMLLRVALRYDKQKDAIMFGNEQPYTRKQLQDGGIGDLVDPMYDFAQSMSELDLDYAEYVLLMAITILSSGEIYMFCLKRAQVQILMDIFSSHIPSVVLGHHFQKKEEKEKEKEKREKSRKKEGKK